MDPGRGPNHRPIRPRVTRLQTAEQARSEAGVPPVHLPPGFQAESEQALREDRRSQAVVSKAEAEMYALEHFHEWLAGRVRRASLRKSAELSGVHHTTISRLISGSREPSLRTALRLLHALGVTQRKR